MMMPEALSSQLRMVATMIESTANLVGDGRFKDVPGLYDGFREAAEILKVAGPLADSMRSLARSIDRPSPQARQWAKPKADPVPES